MSLSLLLREPSSVSIVSIVLSLVVGFSVYALLSWMNFMGYLS